MNWMMAVPWSILHQGLWTWLQGGGGTHTPGANDGRQYPCGCDSGKSALVPERLITKLLQKSLGVRQGALEPLPPVSGSSFGSVTPFPLSAWSSHWSRLVMRRDFLIGVFKRLLGGFGRRPAAFANAVVPLDRTCLYHRHSPGRVSPEGASVCSLSLKSVLS